MSAPYILVSHSLCPYVQRAAIVLDEKGVPFERRDISLADKPAWFHSVSPLGKTPVLLIGNDALFESSVICEYLDETVGAPLHPRDPLERAKHRAWMAYGSELLDAIGAFYRAPDEAALQARARDIRQRFERLERVIGEGPYFAHSFSLVDAVFGPVFRYFDVFDQIADFGFWAGLPQVQRWRSALAARPSVQRAVDPAYGGLLRNFIASRGGALARRAA